MDEVEKIAGATASPKVTEVDITPDMIPKGCRYPKCHDCGQEIQGNMICYQEDEYWCCYVCYRQRVSKKYTKDSKVIPKQLVSYVPGDGVFHDKPVKCYGCSKLVTETWLIGWYNLCYECANTVKPSFWKRENVTLPGVLHDSGARQEFDTGAVRDTQEGKGRFDLIPPYPIEQLAKLYEAGCKKYGDRNWEKGIPLGRMIDSAMRHLNKWVQGKRDEPHLVQAAWNILNLIHFIHEIEEGRLPDSLDDNNYLQRSKK